MNKSFTSAALILFLAASPLAQAGNTSDRAEAAAADLVIARPLWFVATVVGAGLFVVALPIAALSKNVNGTAHTLVGKPAAATFTRPLGDFSSVE